MHNTHPRLVLFIAFGMYLAFGMFNTAIGPVLNELADNAGVPLAMAGGVITFLFLGALTAQLIAGPLTDRFGLRLVVLVSLLLLAFALPAFVSARSFPLMLALVLITGFGQGGIDLSANLMVSSAYPQRTTSMLNLLHFFFGLGAFLGPALVGLAIAVTGSGLVVHWSAAVIFLALAITLLSVRGNNPASQPVVAAKEEGLSGSRNVYLSPLLWIIGMLILFYVGAEVGLSSWATRYMELTAGMALQNGALVTSAYWGAQTVGRLIGAGVSRSISHARLLAIALGGSLAGTLGFAFSQGLALPTILFIILTGFSFGTIYPTSVAVAVAMFPADQGKAVGLLAAAGSIGGLIVPWVGGILLETVSPLAFGVFLCICLIICWALLIALRKLKGKDPVYEQTV